MNPRLRLPLAFTATILGFDAPASARGIERVPLTPQPNGPSGLMNLSGDGRFVVFASDATLFRSEASSAVARMPATAVSTSCLSPAKVAA